MKTPLRWSILALISLVTSLHAASRDPSWNEVEKAVKNGLPKTAIQRLEAIARDALRDERYPEAIRATVQKIALAGDLAGGKADAKIKALQAEIERFPATTRPALEAILAHWYWEFFQQNRWRFAQRTQTASPRDADIESWDLPTILREIDRHFSGALSDPAALQRIAISDYDALLLKGTVPDVYRPTLYDFLAHEALQFYQTGEQAAIEGEAEFDLSPQDPIFGPTSAFLAWQPSSTDTSSPKLRAIQLYQALLKFHRSDPDRSAYYDVDLARILYGSNIATGESLDERVSQALSRFIEQTRDHEISARALAVLAARLAEQSPAEAHKLAKRGAAAFPASAGAVQCKDILRQIEAPEAAVTTERVWNAPWPTLDVTYRNVKKIFFRAVAADIHSVPSESRLGGYVEDEFLERLLDTKPAWSWETTLPATTDFKTRVEQLPAPTTLKPGFYYLLASHNASFSRRANQLSILPIWVSDLALLTQVDPLGHHEGLVLNAKTGEPIADAKVHMWVMVHGKLLAGPTTTTDPEGHFVFSSEDRPVLLIAESGGHSVSTLQVLYSATVTPTERRNERTVLFTDRSIYRPGQTIHYKGVCLSADQTAGQYSVMTPRDVTVYFRDSNNQEVAHAVHRLNDYGSFSGEFIAPQGGLMGSMQLQASAPEGSTSVSVEEYKRPKFQVELNAPSTAARLDAPVTVTGNAQAYTGAAIGNARVKWRVERSARFPSWCWWVPIPERKAIAHGTLSTNADGSFGIEFPATPDRSVSPRNEPQFSYVVHVDVTDSTGETRSSERTLIVGYTALTAAIEADEWQTNKNPVVLKISTKSLNDDPEPAEGVIRVHALKQPTTVPRSRLSGGQFDWRPPADDAPSDPANPDSWALDNVVATLPFRTEVAGTTEVSATLSPGIYRIALETTDRFGKTVTARKTVQVSDPAQSRYAVKLPDHVAARSWSVEPGDTFQALWGTGYDSGRALVEIECDGKVLKRYWTSDDRTQQLITLPINEAMRGGFTLHVTSVRENRAYTTQRIVDVPWKNKELDVRWETFRSKLEPGKKEVWTAIVSGPQATQAAAEMVATLYDASLDQFRPNSWPSSFTDFRREWLRANFQFQNAALFFHNRSSWPDPETHPLVWQYRSFPPEIVSPSFEQDVVVLSAFSVASEGQRSLSRTGGRVLGPTGFTLTNPKVADVAMQAVRAPEAVQETSPLESVAARRNLAETAFFLPHLTTTSNGEVRIEFHVPEALTEWRFLGFAHDKELRSGLLTDKAVTSKELMVEPNPPRFLREGDIVEFSVKVSNQSEQSQTGTVRLTFTDAASQQSVDAVLGVRTSDQSFELPAKQSRSFFWRITIPDAARVLTYKAVASTRRFSDGEEGFVPVLSRRVLVTESLPLPVRRPGVRQFEFKKLLDSGQSPTLQHQALTVQMVSQPAWYAVLALPYLMEFPHECSEQVFNRFYANALARTVANSDPKIRDVFEQWKNTPALESPLAKNQELKSVLLEETPWLRNARTETQNRKNVGLLFDEQRLDRELASALRLLSERQNADGLWSWFPGGKSSEYITLYITAGFGRLRHLRAYSDVAPAIRALDSLDAWMTRRYREILKAGKPDDYVPSFIDALYLYMRSFFLTDRPISGPNRVAVDFFLRRSADKWLALNSLQSQAQLALALQRFGNTETAQAIMRSLKERSVTSDELGMHWNQLTPSWWWYQAPIESQAVLIEAFLEVAQDAKAVEDCRVWLLKQKQTQEWSTTKATADAVYALLLTGQNLLGSDALVEVSLGGKAIQPEKVEAGSGFYEKKFPAAEITPAMGHITVTKNDDGVSWGSVHWQYLEDMTRVTPYAGTPLKLKKRLFVKETTTRGQVLKPVDGPINVGDELVVRLELQVDRDMEFVHLKDQRGSGVEPVDVLSRYQYREGLGYYESTRDAATHFFIDYLPKGAYVFEYSTRVQLRGQYQSGIAEIQCMYAPEFNSHSESHPIEVK